MLRNDLISVICISLNPIAFDMAWSMILTSLGQCLANAGDAMATTTPAATRMLFMIFSPCKGSADLLPDRCGLPALSYDVPRQQRQLEGQAACPQKECLGSTMMRQAMIKGKCGLLALPVIKGCRGNSVS